MEESLKPWTDVYLGRSWFTTSMHVGEWTGSEEDEKRRKQYENIQAFNICKIANIGGTYCAIVYWIVDSDGTMTYYGKGWDFNVTMEDMKNGQLVTDTRTNIVFKVLDTSEQYLKTLERV